MNETEEAPLIEDDVETKDEVDAEQAVQEDVVQEDDVQEEVV